MNHILGFVPLGIFAVAAVVWFVRWAHTPPKDAYPQDTFSVITPAEEFEVVGYLRILPESGILTFLNESGKHTVTFSPSGWRRVIKVAREAA